QSLGHGGLASTRGPDQRDGPRSTADGIHVPLLGCSRPEGPRRSLRQDDRCQSKRKIGLAVTSRSALHHASGIVVPELLEADRLLSHSPIPPPVRPPAVGERLDRK